MKSNILNLAANDAAETMLANAADGGSPFAILQPDGFLVPFGEYPHKQGLQLFDRTAAEEIVKAHNSALAKVTRWITGGQYPIYVGHPDLPGSKDADKRAYGWIENMRVTDDGLHLSAKWSEAGRELVENAHFKFYSPLWWTKKVKGGIRPIALKSMGLTNDPNIPVPALANEAEEEVISDQSAVISEEESLTENNNDMTPEILAALGLEEGATPDSVLAKITALKDSAEENAETLKAEKLKAEEADAAKADAEAKATQAEEKKTEAENERDTAKAEAATLTERLKLAANAAVQHAVQAGRVTPAEAEAKLGEILAANDFEAAITELAKAPAKFKTVSQTGALGEAKARVHLAANDESAAAKAKRARLVENEFVNTNPALSLGERKRLAWNRARAKDPEVFGGKKDSTGTAA